MSSDTCLKIEYNFGLVGLHLNLHVSEIKNFLQDITHSRNSAKTEHFTVMLLNFCVYITTVNQINVSAVLVAASVCESLCTSNN